MSVSPLLSLPQKPGAFHKAKGVKGAAELGGKDFTKLLKKAEDATFSDEKAKAERAKEADQAATGLVSNALILPILQQVRRSMEESKGPFSPGKGENAFGPQFDIQLADRIAQSPRLGIKTAIVNRLLARDTAVRGRDAHVKQELDVHG